MVYFKDTVGLTYGILIKHFDISKNYKQKCGIIVFEL